MQLKIILGFYLLAEVTENFNAWYIVNFFGVTCSTVIHGRVSCLNGQLCMKNISSWGKIIY